MVNLHAGGRLARPEISATSPHRGWRQRVAALADHRGSTWLLAGVAFADSSFLPLPPDLLFVPLSLLRPERMRFLAILCIAASSLGAGLGYLIGWGLWSTIGLWLVDFYHCQETFAAYQHLVAKWGTAIIIAKAFTPLPFKIAAIAAGVGGMNPWTFMAAAIASRALHFAMLVGLLMLCGARIMALIARYERRLAILSVVAAVIAAAVAWYLR